MPRKTLKGVIVKKSGDKTYKVMVVERKPHPLYRKVMNIKRYYLAHSEKEHKIGEEVIIRETRRISKLKHFIIVDKKKQ